MFSLRCGHDGISQSDNKTHVGSYVQNVPERYSDTNSRSRRDVEEVSYESRRRFLVRPVRARFLDSSLRISQGQEEDVSLQRVLLARTLFSRLVGKRWLFKLSKRIYKDINKLSWFMPYSFPVFFLL